jgi:hypothetical protein
VSWESAHQWLVNTRPVRRVVDAVLRRRARGQLVELDYQYVARSQARILRGLVHRARATLFGREHDFHRIRTPEDFRRLVPLQTADDLRCNGLQPGACMATELAGGHYRSALTALGLIGEARPHARPLLGSILFVHEAESVAQASLTTRPIVRRLLAFAPGLPSAESDDYLHMGVTAAGGQAGRLVEFFADAKRATGRDHIADIWPGLAAVLYAPGPNESDLAALLGDIGTSPGPLLLEACWRAEGPIAVEHPRYGLMRLLTDHGVYFEFVPIEDLGKPQPTRHTATEVEPGVVYVVAMTSAAGVWARLTDVTVRFERRDPPLLQRLHVESHCALRAHRARRDQFLIASPPHPFMAQPPHPRNGDSLAAPPGTSGRSLWSARAGRG